MCGENFTITCFFLLLQPRGNKISGNRRTGELEDHIGHSFGFAWLLNRTKHAARQQEYIKALGI